MLLEMELGWTCDETHEKLEWNYNNIDPMGRENK